MRKRKSKSLLRNSLWSVSIIWQKVFPFDYFVLDFVFKTRPDNKIDEGRVVLNDPYPDKLPAATRK